jgi:hypothetical protein
MEAAGLVHTRRDERGALAVRLGPASDAVPDSAPPPQPTLGAPIREQRARPLKQPVWDAWVNDLIPTLRRIDPATGTIWWTNAVTPPHSADRWLDIKPIPSAEQLGWAKQFLIEKGLADTSELSRALQGDAWYVRFPIALGQIERSLSFEWKRLRSRKVVELIQNWCQQNQIDPELLFEPSGSRADRGGADAITTRKDARHVMLQALAQLTTEQLLAIPIPAKVILEVIGWPTK